MIHIWKRAAGSTMSVLIVVALPIISAAAVKMETRVPITSVSIWVRLDVRADHELDEAIVYTTMDNNLYTIGVYKWANKNKEYWEPGDEPKTQIEIHARNGYYFNRTMGPNKFQIDGAAYAPAKRTNNDEMPLLTVKLAPASGILEIPENVEWMGYPPGKATWFVVPFAGTYELRLYREDQMIQGMPKVIVITYDSYPSMTLPGIYQFRVRAIPKDSEELGCITGGDWVYSDECDINVDEVCSLIDAVIGSVKNRQLTPAQIGWVKDNEGWWCRNTDGTYPSGIWQNIDGEWYLSDFSGYILAGWQTRNGKNYFLGISRAMNTERIQDNRKWHHLEEDGAMHTGWLNVQGQQYFFDQDGSIHTGWLTDNGLWYYINPNNGTMLRDTSVEGRYLDSEGRWRSREHMQH